MEKGSQNSNGLIAILAVIAVIGGSLVGHSNSLSSTAGDIADGVGTIFRTFLYFSLGGFALWGLYLLGSYIIQHCDEFTHLKHGQQKQIDKLADLVSRYDDHASQFHKKVSDLNRQFVEVQQAFRDFKKEFHDDWKTSAGSILREAAKDPKVVATLKDSLFPKMKALESKLKTEDENADKQRYAIDQLL